QIYFPQSAWLALVGWGVSRPSDVLSERTQSLFESNSKALCKGLTINKLTLKSLQNHHNAGRWNRVEAISSVSSQDFFVDLFVAGLLKIEDF
ncbi:hypothetical protein, partial [Emticicia oligotrophica]|uniref:hypothetical protein n=1 Tax=Emticicia oligotrophica TaxID=312279 RepID=UPI00273AD7E0